MSIWQNFKQLEETSRGKWIVFALCLFVIFESVMIVNSLSRASRQAPVSWKETGNEATPSQILNKLKENKKARLYFDGPFSWKKGEEGELKLVLVPLADFNLDGVDLVLSYEPEKVKIEKVAVSDIFDTQARSLVQAEKKRVVISLLELAKKEGVSFKSGEEVVLATLKLKPLMSGGEKAVLSLWGGEGKGSGTNLIEAGTGKRVPFSGESYYLTVTE